MPEESSSYAKKPLVAVTRLVLRFPRTTIAVGVLLAIGATVWSNFSLGFRTKRVDLINPKSEFNRLWLDYVAEFGDQEDAVVVIEGSGREQVVPVRNELAQAIAREKQLFHSVLYRVDPAKLRSKGLYYLPAEDLQKVEGFLDRAEPIVRGQWTWLNVRNMGEGMCLPLAQGPAEPAARAAAEEQLVRFHAGLLAALENRYCSPWPEMQTPGEDPREADAQELLANDGRIGFVLFKLVAREGEGEFVHGTKGIRVLRELIARTQAMHSEVKIGLTGLPVIEHDEMDSSQTSMVQVSALSFVGVLLLFVAGFGCWRHPLLAVLSLTIGTAWSMGYITLAIGHLNILSSAFAVILIGQGIDFSMYYVAQYMQLRSQVHTTSEALVRTVSTVGPGIATGAITTAAAFFMAGLTEFTGVAELGIVAGGGLLLCWIAGMTVLPAMIHVVDTRWTHWRVPLPVDVRCWLDPLLRRPKLLLAVTSAGTIVLAFGLAGTRYDHNLLHLQARGLESVELEQKLLRESDQNASFALSIADSPQELQARKARFLELPSVKRVEEIASRLPEDVESKRPIIQSVHGRLTELEPAIPRNGPPVIPATMPAHVSELLIRSQQWMASSPRAAEFRPLVERTMDALRRLTPQECQTRLTVFQQRMSGELLARLEALRGASNPEPPQLADLPEGLVARFVSPRGRYLMRIYSNGDIWDMEAMEQFVADVRSVDSRATGNPLQVYEASRQMQRSYEQAALYALAIILPVVFLDFRSVRSTLLALLPLGLGMVQMFGLMGLLGIPLNPANMIVLPLILGIGIDAGVHVVHDYLSQRGRYQVNASTASAVVINTVTNMAGFGSLMIASHRGLQSLGRVLTLGLTCCLFTSLVMLPALLTLWSRRREPAEEETPAEIKTVAEWEAELAAMREPLRKAA